METLNKALSKINNYFASIGIDLKISLFDLSDLDVSSILDNAKLLEYTFEYEID
jgi:alcohol dehydrogenase YqhD (iron-dependent ADH family)